jgi:hypothetical protein
VRRDGRPQRSCSCAISSLSCSGGSRAARGWTGPDRALLATLLAVIPKARRRGLHLLVTPDTILRWHRDIVRRRWAARSIRGKTGRPATRRKIRALVLRLARENPGYVATAGFTGNWPGWLDRSQANLALARHQLKRIESTLTF